MAVARDFKMLAMLLAVPAFGPHNAAAQSDLWIENATSEQESLLLAGIANGIVASWASSLAAGRPLYCPPADFQISGKVVKRLAAKSLVGPFETQVIAIAAMQQLMTDYPCK